MTAEFLLLLAAGAMAGGFVTGLAGFGTALFALGFWLQAMPPQKAVAAVVVMSVVSGLQGVYLVRRDINWPRLSLFAAPAVVGVPLGVGLLALVEPKALKLLIAGFLILYGGFFTFRRSLPNLTRPTPLIDALLGLVSGVLGGAAGLSGALPAMWSALRDWTKWEKRAVMQPFNVLILGLTALMLAWRGVYDRDVMLTIAAALPVSLASAQVGIIVFKRLTDDQFRRLLITLLLVSGVVLMIREIS